MRLCTGCVAVGLVLAPAVASAQAPEIALREFASGQIKKGVRAIGFGGDGATWGNYGLVYREAGGALIDWGVTSYTNGNDFTFTAVGFTSPKLWHDLAIYAIALSQHATDTHLSLASPFFGDAPVPVHGDGANQAIFIKAAMPLGYGFSAGVLLSYELSQYDVVPDQGPGYIHLETQWRPSGGFGVAWQPTDWILIGTRFILNNDLEIRTDPTGSGAGIYHSFEERLGGSVSLWRGGLLDAGMTGRQRIRGLDGTSTGGLSPNLGIEQSLFDKHLALRAGYDESSPTVGLTAIVKPFRLDVAYVYDLGMARVGKVFGTTSNSVLVTFTYDYASTLASKPAA